MRNQHRTLQTPSRSRGLWSKPDGICSIHPRYSYSHLFAYRHLRVLRLHPNPNLPASDQRCRRPELTPKHQLNRTTNAPDLCHIAPHTQYSSIHTSLQPHHQLERYNTRYAPYDLSRWSCRGAHESVVLFKHRENLTAYNSKRLHIVQHT